jgi:hypothetical protein
MEKHEWKDRHDRQTDMFSSMNDNDNLLILNSNAYIMDGIYTDVTYTINGAESFHFNHNYRQALD